MIITAIYEDGVLKPEGPLHLEEHERVEVTVRSISSDVHSAEERATALEKFWRERTPIHPSKPRPTRDELYDRA